MNHKIYTIVEETKPDSLETIFRSTATNISSNLPPKGIPSKWFFYTTGFVKIYLKTGWNTFGRKRTNTFDLRSNQLKKCEMYMFVPVDCNILPSVYAVHDNLWVNGCRLGKNDSPWYLESRTNIGIARENRVVHLMFCHDNM